MSEHETMPDDEKRAAVERLTELSAQNRRQVEALRGKGRMVHPLAVLEARLDVLLDLAFGQIPVGETIDEFAEKISDARLIFEVEWQERQRRLIADAKRNAEVGDLVVPKSGKLHLP